MLKRNADIAIKNVLGISNRALLTEKDWNPNYPYKSVTGIRDGEFVIADSFICRNLSTRINSATYEDSSRTVIS